MCEPISIGILDVILGVESTESLVALREIIL